MRVPKGCECIEPFRVLSKTRGPNGVLRASCSRDLVPHGRVVVFGVVLEPRGLVSAAGAGPEHAAGLQAHFHPLVNEAHRDDLSPARPAARRSLRECQRRRELLGRLYKALFPPVI